MIAADREAVESPCTLVCSIDPATGWCIGCRRTLEEIARWGSATSAEQREILAAIQGRGTP